MGATERRIAGEGRGCKEGGSQLNFPSSQPSGVRARGD